jgi:hypothetical protein
MAGRVPHLWFEVSSSYGQTLLASSGSASTFTEHDRSGEVRDYTFAVRELKQPLQQTVTDSGWTWKGIAFGKL